jgi:hypothetical protein
LTEDEARQRASEGLTRIRATQEQIQTLRAGRSTGALTHEERQEVSALLGALRDFSCQLDERFQPVEAVPQP